MLHAPKKEKKLKNVSLDLIILMSNTDYGKKKDHWRHVLCRCFR